MGCGKSTPSGKGGEGGRDPLQGPRTEIRLQHQPLVSTWSDDHDDNHDRMGGADDVITILHFNDVYNIEPREQEPVGGAARFVTALRSHAADNPMVLFSGDVFNPSLMSSITKGKQMVPVLNSMNIQCACYGNHDFDFGVDVLTKMAANCNFPWLLTNVFDNFTDKPLADGITHKIIEWQGRKFGILGLVEEEWIATLATVDADDITFIDYVTEGRRLATELRSQGADYIIALTHMRWPNDRRLAREADEIDIILGGHDHDYNTEQIGGKWVIKSGTDFREYSKIKLHFHDCKVDVSLEKCIVDSSIKEDEAVKEVVDKYVDIMGEKMESVIGHMEVELDGRFASIRTKETNLGEYLGVQSGNFITDIMLEAVEADMALLNSGTLRSDAIHPRGPFKMKDLCSILPMVDPLVVLKLTGRQVLNALENSVSQYPALEGRFPQVAGVEFAFDPEKPALSRIDPRYVRIQGAYLDLNKHYRLVTKHYLAEGKDGYNVLKDGEILVNDEEGPRLNIIVQNHFKSVQIVKGHKIARTPHRQSIISINRRRSVVRQMTLPESASAPLTSPPRMSPMSPTSPTFSYSGSETSITSAASGGTATTPNADQPQPRRAKGMLTRRASIQSVEMDCMSGALAPKVEGRILVIDEQRRHDLEQMRLAAETAAITIEEKGESAPPTPGAIMDTPNLPS